MLKSRMRQAVKLGRLNRLRQEAHLAFDAMWACGVFPTRVDAYQWMSEAMELSLDEAHIAKFDEEQCELLIEVVNELADELGIDGPD